MKYTHKSNSQVKVGGKMSESGADKVGKMQAWAWLILAVGIAVSLVIFAVKF